MLARSILTLVVLGLWAIISWVYCTASPIIASKFATQQFCNSDSSYLVSRGYRLFTGNGLPVIIILAVLVLIWWKPIKKIFSSTVAALILCAFMATSASAYYDKTNWVEPYFILPNESAFFIPDVGANKESQAGFGSEAYLRENKIPAKRFEIPHAKLAGSAYWGEYYVPTGRLIIVDRTPYNREWVHSHERGTSAKDESFPCQSKEGINVTAEVSIAASVKEEDSPRFLYNFGVKPPAGDRTKPEVIFTSVYHGVSLAEVMDKVVRGKIQAIVAHKIGKRDLDKVNEDSAIIMSEIFAEATEFCKSIGVTLTYIGWAGTFSFDKDVQQAINDRYTGEKIKPVLATLQTKAVLDMMGKWNGQLPTTLSGFWLITSDISSTVASWFKHSPEKK